MGYVTLMSALNLPPPETVAGGVSAGMEDSQVVGMEAHWPTASRRGGTQDRAEVAAADGSQVTKTSGRRQGRKARFARLSDSQLDSVQLRERSRALVPRPR